MTGVLGITMPQESRILPDGERLAILYRLNASGIINDNELGIILKRMLVLDDAIAKEVSATMGMSGKS